MRFLENYKKYDENVFIKSCQVILDKSQNSSPFADTYFYFFFTQCSPKSWELLVSEFKNNYELLSNMYIATDDVIESDYNGMFFYKISCVYPDIVTKLVSKMLEKNICSYQNSYFVYCLKTLWKHENYIDLINTTIDYISNNNHDLSFYNLVDYLEALLIPIEGYNIDPTNENIILKQDVWIKHYIEKHSSCNEKIIPLFRAITGLSWERRINFVLYFLKLKPSIELFEQINLTPSSYIGSSLIPPMEDHKKFLKMLLEELNCKLTGIDYLDYKVSIEDKIKCKKTQIECEDIREMSYKGR